MSDSHHNAHDKHADREALFRRAREKRERERAELIRIAESGSVAEHRALAAAQSEGIVGFSWSPLRAVRRKP